MGRPRKYASDAERQRAYRRRRRERVWSDLLPTLDLDSSQWGRIGNIGKRAMREYREEHLDHAFRGEPESDDCRYCALKRE